MPIYVIRNYRSTFGRRTSHYLVPGKGIRHTQRPSNFGICLSKNTSRQRRHIMRPRTLPTSDKRKPQGLNRWSISNQSTNGLETSEELTPSALYCFFYIVKIIIQLFWPSIFHASHPKAELSANWTPCRLRGRETEPAQFSDVIVVPLLQVFDGLFDLTSLIQKW